MALLHSARHLDAGVRHFRREETIARLARELGHRGALLPLGLRRASLELGCDATGKVSISKPRSSELVTPGR